MCVSSPGQDTTSNFEDDDPTKEREAELLLEYIEQFNDLFEDKRYSEAAMHAANSPKGILRNPETLARFKGNLRKVMLSRCDWTYLCPKHVEFSFAYFRTNKG